MGKIFHINGKPHSINFSGHALSLAIALASSTSLQAEVAPEIATRISPKKAITAQNWMAVTANKYATTAASQIIQAGGSAVDAAIAAQLVLGLVEPQSSGIGGGGFMLHYHNESKKLLSFDGRETAPNDINENHFIDTNKPMGFFDAVVGGHSVGTPGLLHMLHQAHLQYGTLAWADLFQPAITLAENGFVVSARLHKLLKHMQKTPNGLKDPGMAAYFLTASGKVKRQGSLLKNPAYAATLKAISLGGIDAFYRGDIAKAIANSVQNNVIRPGVLSTSDLADYKSLVNDAVCHVVDAYRLCGAALPASGPATVMQILSMLTKTPGFYGLAADSSAFYHRFSESSKLAFADRDKYMADPAFVDMPIDTLLSDKYLTLRAQQIPLRSASNKPATAGEFEGAYSFAAADSAEIPSTTHLSIIDKDGNIVSMTSSIEMAFGSQIMVKGFLLNNQLTDFSFTAEDAQQKKIANRIEAGKRPRSSMAPMLIFNQQTQMPVLVIGSPGGSRIIDYVSKTIAQHLYLGADLKTAINTTHLVNLNKVTEVEKNRPQSLALGNNLKKLGHNISYKDQTSGIHAISLMRGEYQGIADARREGTAYGE